MRPAHIDRAERPPETRANTRKAKKKKQASTAGPTSANLPPSMRNEPPPRSGPQTSLAAGIVSPCHARIDWASLLRRIYLEDVLACPCGGRRHVIADITDHDAIVAILNHFGLAPDAPKVARARDPTDDAA